MEEASARISDLGPKHGANERAAGAAVAGAGVGAGVLVLVVLVLVLVLVLALRPDFQFGVSPAQAPAAARR
jgi:hypothetical protein